MIPKLKSLILRVFLTNVMEDFSIVRAIIGGRKKRLRKMLIYLFMRRI